MPSDGIFAKAAEEDREHHHHHHGLDDGPGEAEHGLLVAHLDVAHGEHEEELAIGPELLEVERAPALDRLDDRDVLMAEILLVDFVYRVGLTPVDDVVVTIGLAEASDEVIHVSRKSFPERSDDSPSDHFLASGRDQTLRQLRRSSAVGHPGQSAYRFAPPLEHRRYHRGCRRSTGSPTADASRKTIPNPSPVLGMTKTSASR